MSTQVEPRQLGLGTLICTCMWTAAFKKPWFPDFPSEPRQPGSLHRDRGSSARDHSQDLQHVAHTQCSTHNVTLR